MEPKTFFLFFYSFASIFCWVDLLSVWAEKFNSIAVIGFLSLARASLIKLWMIMVFPVPVAPVMKIGLSIEVMICRRFLAFYVSMVGTTSWKNGVGPSGYSKLGTFVLKCSNLNYWLGSMKYSYTVSRVAIWNFAKKSRIMLSRNLIALALKCPPKAQKNEKAKNDYKGRVHCSLSSFCSKTRYFPMKYSRKLHKFMIIWISMLLRT